MRYHIIHRTTYTYESPVTVGHYTARLEPRSLPQQECPWHELHIRPKPVERAKRSDYFGNATVYFEIAGAHQKLEVISRSLIEVQKAELPDPATTVPWETIRDGCRGDGSSPLLLAGELAFASSLIPVGPAFAE